MSFAKLFARPHYTSPATDFLQALKRDYPVLPPEPREAAGARTSSVHDAQARTPAS